MRRLPPFRPFKVLHLESAVLCPDHVEDIQKTRLPEFVSFVAKDSLW